MLRELLSPGGTVTGQGEQLIIRTTADNLADLKRVLATLDRPLRRLRISVRQDLDHAHAWQEDALAGRIEAGDAAVGISGPVAGDGLRLDTGGDGRGLSYRRYATRGREDQSHAHFVTAVEGRPAFISTGQQVPLGQRQLLGAPFGGVVVDSIEYRDVGHGFYVTPRLQADTVLLDIAPHGSRLARDGGGVIDTQGLTTTVSGPLGSWIALGGAGQAGTTDAGRIVQHTRGSSEARYDVWVKVDLLP